METISMRVTKRDGELEEIAFDKILLRIKKLGQEANIQINYQQLVMKVIDQLYDTISTTKIDELAAEQCASLSTLNPDYGTLAGRINVSNHQKNTVANFSNVINDLYNFTDIHGNNNPLVSQNLFNFVTKFSKELDNMLRDSDPIVDSFLGTKAEPVQLIDLKPHPKHYKVHLDDQLEHLANSIKQHGFYRNVVVAKDYTILDGHGVVSACHKLKLKEVPVIKLDIESDSPQALKILTGNNEIGKLAEIDDRKLSELLKEVKDKDGLSGTGYDKMMLANLVMVTRPQHEINDINEAAEWVGMPDYVPKDHYIKYTIIFKTEQDRNEFCNMAKIPQGKEKGRTWSVWWPLKEKEDLKSVKYE